MTTATMTIRTDAKTLKKITALASSLDRSRNWVVADAIHRYLAEEEAEKTIVKEALASLDRGEGIPHDQVMDEMDIWLAPFGIPAYTDSDDKV